LPDHTVACHYAEELVAKDRRQELVGRAAEATTGRTVAPEDGLAPPSTAGADADANIFDLDSQDPTIR
ncbi:MAG TPA: hypothetical protein VIH19_05285, partial [Candidatus Limnocylindria bacterium]